MILHIKDDFSKWSSLFPLKSKTAAEVAPQMAIWIRCYGVPEILQCDNGREFKGILLILLQKHGIKVRNGRPQTPQIQGLVKQANGTLKTKLRAWNLDTVASGGNPHCPSQALPEIALSINRQPHSSLGGRSPYEVMFNRKPCWKEAIPIHSRLQQTLNNIPEEHVQLGSGIQDQRDEERDMLVETMPPVINAGALGTGFSFDDMDYSRMSDAGRSPVQEPELEVENQALPIPDIHSSPVSIENMIVPTVLEEAMQDEAARARARSSNQYNKQHTIECFLAGDIVSLKILREDRAATDSPRIFWQVITESYPNRYKLQTSYGVLKNFYPVNVLLRVPEAAGINLSIPTTLMATGIIRYAAAGMISTSHRINICCNCQGPECSGRCRCIRNKVPCSVHCHSLEFNCGNLSPLATQTELALIERYSPDT